MKGGQLASPSFYLHHQLRGEKSGDDPDGSALLNRLSGPRRTACATRILHHGECPVARQSRCCPIHRRLTKSSWLAGPENTATYTFRSVCATRKPRQPRAES